MSAFIRSRMSFAVVISAIAIAVALAGTGYAALKLPRNSVGAKQLKKSAVRSAKVKNGSLRRSDVRRRDLRRGSRGAPGSRGARGVAGARGGVQTVTVVRRRASTDVPDNGQVVFGAYCPVGMRAVGGGVRGDDTDPEETKVVSSRPSQGQPNTQPPVDNGTFRGWRVTVVNPAGGATTGLRPEAWASCLPAG